MACYPWNKLYKRKVFDGVRYTPNVRFEDVLIMPYIYENAGKGVVISECLYIYDRTRELSITNRNKSDEYLFSNYYVSKRLFVEFGTDFLEAYDNLLYGLTLSALRFYIRYTGVDYEDGWYQAQNDLKQYFYEIIKNKRVSKKLKIEMFVFRLNPKFLRRILRLWDEMKSK